MSKREEWEALGETGQYKMILGVIGKVAKRQGHKLDALDYVGAVWLKTVELLDGSALDLPLIVWRAAVSEIGREARQLRKYADADNTPVRGGDGDEIGSLLDLVSDGGSVEALAILRADFSAWYDGLSDGNKEIIRRRALDGETMEKIADRLDVSYPAIWMRLHRMRGHMAAFTY